VVHNVAVCRALSLSKDSSDMNSLICK